MSDASPDLEGSQPSAVEGGSQRRCDTLRGQNALLLAGMSGGVACADRRLIAEAAVQP